MDRLTSLELVAVLSMLDHPLDMSRDARSGLRKLVRMHLDAVSPRAKYLTSGIDPRALTLRSEE